MKVLALLVAVLGLSGCIVVPVHDGPGYRSYGYYGPGHYGYRHGGYYRYRERYP